MAAETPAQILTRHEQVLLALRARPPGSGAPGAQGPAGLSAYEEAVAAGYVGTEAQWLASLVGAQGPQGVQGPPGPAVAEVGWTAAFTPNSPVTGTARYAKTGRVGTLDLSLSYAGSWSVAFTAGTLPAAALPATEQRATGWWNGYVSGFCRIRTDGVVIVEQAAATTRSTFSLSWPYMTAT